jgi:hypothetical protein
MMHLNLHVKSPRASAIYANFQRCGVLPRCAYKVHAHEAHAREMHAYEVHAHEVYLMEMQAYKMHAREVQINPKRPHMRFVEI